MRYRMAESSYIIAAFAPGHSVTITIYKLSDSSVVVNAAAMTEIGSTGLFKYLQSIAPVVATEYLWVATDGYDQRAGKIVLGGYPDTLATSQAAEESDIGTIQANIVTIKASQADEESDIAIILSRLTAARAGYLDTLSDLAAMLEVDGAVKRFTANALELIPTGVSGSVAYPAIPDPFLDPDDNPIEGVQVECYSDSDRTTIVDVQLTDANGLYEFHLDPATYYFRARKVGYTTLEWGDVVS